MGGKPYPFKMDNAINMFNETLVSAYIYVLMIISEFYGDINYQTRQQCGIALATILTMSIVINLMNFIFSIFKQIRILLRKYFHSKANKEPAQPISLSDNQNKYLEKRDESDQHYYVIDEEHPPS